MTGSTRPQERSDMFMMLEFKVKPCPRLDHHNWKHCPHRHPGEVAAQRRHPSLHKPAFCMNLKLYGSCAAGDDCPFSHNTFEMSLHPERYKTTLCTLGDKCNREICFFAHSTEDLRTPDVTAPLGAMGQDTSLSATNMNTGPDANGSGAADASSSGAANSDSLTQLGVEGVALMQQQAGSQQPGLQHLLQQQLQLDPSPQQQLLQHEQQALLLAQVQQQQQQHQQHQQQMNDLALAQHQLLLSNAAGNGGVVMSSGVPSQGGMLSPSGLAAAGAMQRGGGGVSAMQQQQQQQLMPMMLQDATGAHRGESFTSQCSSSSFVTGMGGMRAAAGSLPVSPLIDRSAHSFTITDRSTTGSFSTLGSVPERPHSFSVGDRPGPGVLGSLGERPQSFTLLDASRPNSFTVASRPNSFTLGQQQPPAAYAITERSSASFSVLENSHGGLSLMEGAGGLVERGSQTQRSFTMGQRPPPQLLQQQANGVAWYERDSATGMLAASQVQADANGAVYQLVSPAQYQEQAQQPQQQQAAAGARLGLNALFGQWR